jgi:formylglycine-generating enzyme required for sulfatase activity
MRLLVLILLFITYSIPSSASDIKIESVEWSRNNNNSPFQIKFTISWNNAWRTDKNFDAAWVFVKYESPSYHLTGYKHAKMVEANAATLINHVNGAPQATIDVTSDGVGAFIFPSANYRGRVKWTIELTLDTAILSDPTFRPYERIINVYAIEMVHVPEGKFTIGDADTSAYSSHAIFVSDGNGRPAGLKTIASEDEPLLVSKEKGALYYHVNHPQYQGDQKGTIPQEFPKGYHAYYVMKYETTQGLYAAFLNSIASGATFQRANFGGRFYYDNRGTIRHEADRYIAGSPNRPCNFLSWDDGCAFADWAGLRPMTEFEFEKACRGPGAPGKKEFPWNTNSKSALQRYVNDEQELVFGLELNESQLSDNNREKFGASFYWIFDLAGSLWERCITIGDSTGRAFRGTHGDGVLAPYGFASNADWPKGSTETSGFGFRGGGFYELNMLYGGFNPHSPIAHRNFGAWSGGNRSVAYGTRFVRTADRK